MSTQKKASSVSESHRSLIAAALVSAIVSGVTTAGALSLASSADDYARSVISRTNASANPYRPIEADSVFSAAPDLTVPSSESARQSVVTSGTQTDRRIQAVQRDIFAIERRIAALVRRMESLERNRERETNAARASRYEKAILRLRSVREALETRSTDLALTLIELNEASEE